MLVVRCNLVSPEIRRNTGNFQFCNIRTGGGGKRSLKNYEEAKNEERLLLYIREVNVFGVEMNHMYT